MEIGISTWVFEELLIDEAIQEIHKSAATIHKVELWGNTPSHLDPTIIVQLRIDRLAQLLIKKNMEPHACHAPFTNLDLSDPNLCEQSVHVIIKSITFCKKIGCPSLTLHISASPGVKTRSELQKQKEYAIESLFKITDYSQTTGVEVLLENLVPRSNHVRLGSKLEDILDLVDIFKRQGVGICIDTGHSALNNSDPSDDIRRAGRHLKSLHINDNNGVEDLHWIPGTGIIHWSQVFDALRDINYSRVFMLEIEGRDIIHKTIQDAVDYSRTQLLRYFT